VGDFKRFCEPTSAAR